MSHERIRRGRKAEPRYRPESRGRLDRRLRPEPIFLEDRTLLANLQAVLSAYDSGVDMLAQVSNGVSTAASLVDQALGGVSIPLVNLSLNNIPGLNVGSDFLTPFSTALDAAATTWSAAASGLPGNFIVQHPFNPDANGDAIPYDSNGDLVEVTYTNSWSPSLAPLLVTGGDGPWSYLNGDGGLFGAIDVSQATVTLSETLGVNQNPTTGALSFFVTSASDPAYPSSLTVTLNGAIPSGSALSGSLSVGGLADVTAAVTGPDSPGSNALSVSAGLGFTSTLFMPWNQQPSVQMIAQSFGASVNGALELDAAFQAQVPLLSLPAGLGWSGTFTDSFGSDGGSASFTLDTGGITPQDLVNGLISQMFSVGSDVPILGPLTSQLDRPLPLINESVAQLTGLENALPSFPSFPSVLSSVPSDGITGSFPLARGTLALDITPQTIGEFLDPSSTNGVPVNLLSWSSSGDVTLADSKFTVPIFSIGVPDIASAEIDATFGLSATLDYHIGFGVDTSGMYLDAGTHNDPTLEVSFGVNAGLQGQVEVFGFPLAEAGGSIGFTTEPYVMLTAPPGADDPSKVYLTDLARFGSNPASDLLDDLAVGVQGNLTGNISASINLFLFSISWGWGIKIPVFNYERNPSWPAQATGGGNAPSWPHVQFNPQTGVLTFTEKTGGNNEIKLSSPVNGQVNIDWTGSGSPFSNGLGSESEQFNGVQQFVFNGGSGDDTLTAAPGFDVPTRAEAGSGDDSFQFQNSTANTTLVGGSGTDMLAAGSGTDLLVAGSGSDRMQGGSSDGSVDSVYGGSGTDSIALDDGQESVYGGSGDDTIMAMSGSTGTYFIDGGSGSYSAQNPEVIDLSANNGANDSVYGGTGGYNLIKGSAGGDNLIYGGGPDDTIYGGAGYDTIYGGAGADPSQPTNNVIYGGDLGYNLIYGAGGGDLLYGAVLAAADVTYGGNNTIYGGSGNEELFGGDGTMLMADGHVLGDAAGDEQSVGSNLLVAGSGNDTVYGDSTGHDTLLGGAGSDVLWAGSGGDYLAAGTGVNSLFGGSGSDTFQLQFTASGQQPDTIWGNGGATNSLVIAPDILATGTAPSNNDYKIYLTQTAVTQTGNITAQSAVIDGLSDTSQLFVGEGVSGQGIPSNTQIVAITSATSILISNPAGPNATAGGVQISFSEFQATLSNLDNGDVLGEVNFTLPPDVANLALEGGPGNNWLQVAPSVCQNVYLFGGPNDNTLMAGSGNDTLIAGTGTSVLYGGRGSDVLYGGDLPQQDTPVLQAQAPETAASPGAFMQDQANANEATIGPDGKPTKNSSPVEGRDTLIAGSGSSELFAGDGGDVLIGGSVARQVDSSGVPGLAQLQNGDYSLTAGAGRDILVGGSNALSSDLLIAGPGSPGELLIAGQGNDTLVAENDGADYMEGGSGNDLFLGGPVSNTIDAADSLSTGNDTLVGGQGYNQLEAGSGDDDLYDYPTAADSNGPFWNQAVTAAAAAPYNVVLQSPFGPPGGLDSSQATLYNLLNKQETQPGGLGGSVSDPSTDLGNLAQSLDLQLTTDGAPDSVSATQTVGQAIATDLNLLQSPAFPALTPSQMSQLIPWLDEDLTVHADVKQVLLQLVETPGDGLSPNQAYLWRNLLTNDLLQVTNQEQAVATQLTVLALNPFLTSEWNLLTDQSADLNSDATGLIKLLDAPDAADSLIGGSGTDNLYGNPSLPTYMSSAGTRQADTFYNFNDKDTIAGAIGDVNTLMFQGDGTLKLVPDPSTDSAVDLIINNGQPLVLPMTSSSTGPGISNVQYIGIDTGSASGDTVTADFLESDGQTIATLPAPLQGINVQLGNGDNDVINAVDFLNSETLTAGTGSDTIQINSELATGTGNAKSELNPGPQTELDIAVTSADASISVLGGMLSIGPFQEQMTTFAGDFSAFQKLVLLGGPGTNSFTVDNSLGTVVLEGGSGPNADNIFTVDGPGTFDVEGGSGEPDASALIGGVGDDVLVGGPTNVLTFNSDDSANGDTLTLSQSNSIITVTGTVKRSTVDVTATNISSVFANSGSGDDDVIDASAMTLGVTLDEPEPRVIVGGGTNDTSIGGAGNNSLYFSGDDGFYNGGSGIDNQFVVAAPAGQTETFYQDGFFDSGERLFHPYELENIEYYAVNNGGNSNTHLARGDDTFSSSQWITGDQGDLNYGKLSSQQVLTGGNPGAYEQGTDVTQGYLEDRLFVVGAFSEMHLFTGYT